VKKLLFLPAFFACKRNTLKSGKNESEMKYEKRNENRRGNEMKDRGSENSETKRTKRVA
jgi:hypothetical protein